MHRSPLAIALIVVVLLVVGAGLAAWQFVSLPSTGIPHGPAFRLPHHVAQIIVTRERFLPSLHRNPDKDRYRLDLLLVPVTSPERAQTFTLQRQQQRNATQPMTRILGAEGDVVWVQALDLFAIHVQSGRIARLSDFQRINPALELFLTSAHFEFTDRLIAIAPDQRQAYALDPVTLGAVTAAVPKRTGWINPNAGPDAALSSGGFIHSNVWIAALSTRELQSSYKPGFTLPRDPSANPANELRQLHRAEIDPGQPRPRIVSVEPVSGTNYASAAWIRDRREPGLLRLSAPDSLLLLHRASLVRDATVAVSRLKLNGEPLWSITTPISRLDQVLPDATVLGLVGSRTAVSNTVPEPVLVLIDTAEGTTRTVSLWR